ncbi:MAG: hypoxanthine phosphoribosyltransferase [Bacteroidales bacterium]|nr:hypoxanthine phosphoribosyltransferase [Bacteroidales bacterium]
MQVVRIENLIFEEFISYEAILHKIKEMAQQLNHDYTGKNPLFVIVLKGAFFFGSELVRYFEGECEVEFIQLSSYQGTRSTENIQEKLFIEKDLRNKDLIIVEDIVDTGHTLNYLLQRFLEMGVHSIRVAALLFKPDAFLYDFKLDYVGFSIPSDFVVGFGLDYNEKGRNLRGIFKLMKS